MASFKTKIKKRENYDKRITLEAKHNEIIETISNQKESIETLTKRKNEINEILNNKNLSENRDLIISLKDELIDINTKMNANSQNDIDYFLDNGRLLFDYYENKEKTASGENRIINNIKRKNDDKSIMDYFGTKKTDTSNDNVLTKDKIIDSYFSNTDSNYIKKGNNFNIDICTKCNVEKILYLSEGKIVCKTCGDESFILVDSDKPSYKDPPREVTYFSYKRINHFNECLAQFQAKETTDIPQEVYDKILLELKKERITDMTLLTPIKIRGILKKLKKNKYYEHVPHIINKLNGISPPVMNRETEERLRRMFREIQLPFHKFCPKDRKNFLSYSYVLRKFVELLELDEFIECFMLLKDREKLTEQDRIWKNICGYLQWEFIPSV